MARIKSLVPHPGIVIYLTLAHHWNLALSPIIMAQLTSVLSPHMIYMFDEFHPTSTNGDITITIQQEEVRV
jgi:hypothetical protein